MKTWSVYDEAGDFTGAILRGTREFALANIPPGCGVIEGHFDRNRMKVDLETERVVDRDKPRELSAIESQIKARRAIVRLEAKQGRAVRELALDPNSEAARARVLEIDAEIAEHRKALS